MNDQKVPALESMLTSVEVSKLLHISLGSLANDRSGARRIPFYKVMGRVLYSRDDIQHLLASGRRGDDSKPSNATAKDEASA